MHDPEITQGIHPLGSPLKPWHPTQIGRYRIVSLLGEGGMGVVYEAEQDQPKRMVALKVVREDFVTDDLLRRFALESKVLGRLQHAGIAQIFDAGTFDEVHATLPYFAMELVRGQSLTQYANTHALNLRQRLALFSRVCDAVHYAHQKGVIHRDLKPANILVDQTGQPKVLDFGVARLTDADVQATQKTSVGEVVGTLQYMSPEQANADQYGIDVRSDVYSLGVILYELITGRMPYDLSRKLIHEAARIIVLEEPARMSSVNKQLRGDLDVIVAKALEKEKERRYGSAEAMASDVRHYLDDQPITARPASALYQLQKFARRNRALVGGVLIAAAVLVVGSVVSVWQAVRATSAEQLAQTRLEDAVRLRALAEQRQAVADSALLVVDSARQQSDSARITADSARLVALSAQGAAVASAQRATAEADKAQAVNLFLQEMLATSDPANALGEELSVREVLDRAAKQIGTGELQQQPEVRAGIENTIGRTYYALGLYDQAQVHFDSAYAIRVRELGPNHVDVATTAADIALTQIARGEYVTAGETITQSLAVMRRTLSPTDDQITAATQTLAYVRYMAGDNPEAEQLYRDALRLTRQRYGNTGPAVGTRLVALGNFYSYTGQAAKGDTLLQEGLVLREAAFGSAHPEVLSVLVSLSDAAQNQRLYAESEAYMRRAVPVAQTLYGELHPMVANIDSRLGTALESQGRMEEAEPLLRRSLAIRMQVLGEQHSDVQLARTALARLLMVTNRLDEADSLFAQSLATRRATLGPTSPAVASSLGDLGALAFRRSRWSDGEQRYREAMPIWRAAGIVDQEIETQAQIGWGLVKQEKYDEAETVLNEVLARRSERYGEKHFLVADAYEKIAPIYTGRREFAKAESLIVSGIEVRRSFFGPRAFQVAGALQNVSFLREAQGDTAGAIPAMRESMSIYAEIRPASDFTVLGAQRWLARDLCVTGAVAEGDSLARAAIVHMAESSSSALAFRVRGVHGMCLVQQREFGEAERELLAAELGLRELDDAVDSHRDELRQWLVQLYERWGKPEDAARWRP